MNKLNANLQKNVRAVKNILSAEDILVFHFETTDGAACAAIYADGICDKDLLGEQVIRPLSSSERGDSIDEVAKKLTSPEVKKEKSIQAIADEVLSGNTALIVDGLDSALIIGVKKIPVRTITEPPTSIAVKGPREGFIEDIKTNMALLRKRLKTGDLQFETLTVGTRSKSMIAVCYLNGISDLKVKKQIVDRLKRIEIDGIPDASYIAKFLAKKPYSMFKQVGTTEKPDILAAKMLEGRIGIFVDGSPIALTLPYILVEDFQSVQDYLVSPYRATVSRLLRLVSLVIALLLARLLRCGATVQTPTAAAGTVDDHFGQRARSAAFSESGNVLFDGDPRNTHRGERAHAQIRGAGALRRGRAGPGGHRRKGGHRILLRHHYRGPFGHRRLYPTRPCGQPDVAAVCLSDRGGKPRHVRHRAVYGAGTFIPRHVRQLRRAAAGALLAADHARSQRFGRKGGYPESQNAPQVFAGAKQSTPCN